MSIRYNVYNILRNWLTEIIITKNMAYFKTKADQKIYAYIFIFIGKNQIWE